MSEFLGKIVHNSFIHFISMSTFHSLITNYVYQSVWTAKVIHDIGNLTNR